MTNKSQDAATTLPAERAAPAPIALGRQGVTLTTLEDMYRFSVAAYKSGMIPKGFSSAESVMIAVEMGAELGLPPMASIQNIAVINGRPSLWGDGLLGVCQASGVFDHAVFQETLVSKGGGITAFCKVRRLPDGQEVVRSFSMDQAKRAKLAGKTGPWSEYPERMLQLRARAFALRDTFADVLRGMHAAEEERDTIVLPEPRPAAMITKSALLGEEADAPAVKPEQPARPARPQKKPSPAAEKPAAKTDAPGPAEPESPPDAAQGTLEGMLDELEAET